jgi:hypothetical protein
MASAPRRPYFNCRAVKISANSRLLIVSHSILTGQIENFSQAGYSGPLKYGELAHSRRIH